MIKETKIYGQMMSYLRRTRDFYKNREEYERLEDKREKRILEILKKGNGLLGLEEILSENAMRYIEKAAVQET